MSAEQTKTFALLDTTIFFGSIIQGGFASGDAISVKKKSPSSVSAEGVDGTVARAKTGSKLYEIKIKVLQTSAMNAVLTAIYEIQEATGLLLPFAYKDQNGADVFVSPEAWITDLPEMTRGNKINDQEWTIEAANGRLFLGGN